MNAVVTGGSGFIGQNLVRRLLADGHAVHCLVRAGSAARELPPGAVRCVVDYRDAGSLSSCDALEDADAVFHLAGATRALDQAAFVRANVIPTRELLATLVARRLRPRFVLVSSQAAAGPAASHDRPIDERDAPRPTEAYGRSKLEAERIVAAFDDRVPTTVVRPCAVLGPHDRDFLRLFQLATRGVIVYPGTAHHWLSLLHVDDVVDGLLRAATRDQAISRTYFLAPVSPVQWLQLGMTIGTVIGRQVRHVDLPGSVVRVASEAGQLVGRIAGRAMLANRHKAALARHAFWVCSADRARTELGFRETYSLPDAVRDTYLWYVERGWVNGAGSRVARVS